MSVLPDHEIAHHCREILTGWRLIEPYDREQLQPASYDVRLAPDILKPLSNNRPLDLRHDSPPQGGRSGIMVPFSLDDEDGYDLLPGKAILGSTAEIVRLPNYLVGRIEGKSSLARVGIQVHSAGYLDPGFCGNVTLEIVNFFPWPVHLWTGMRVAQLSFDFLHSNCERPYGSPGLGNHYQDSSGTISTRYGQPGT